MSKRMMSFLLTVAMVLSLCFVPASAVTVAYADEEDISIFMTIDEEEIEFCFIEENGTRYVTYEEKGVSHVVSYNLTTGVLKQDDVVVSVVEPESAELIRISLLGDRSVVAPCANRNWKLYETSDGDITSDIITTAGWVATIGALIGGTFALTFQDAVEDMARNIAQKALPTVYYTHKRYYDANSTTSRPQTGSVYIFYSDYNMTKEIGKLDLRPSY